MRRSARPVFRSALRRDRRMRTARARRNLSRPVLRNSPSASPAGSPRFSPGGRPDGRDFFLLHHAARRPLKQVPPGRPCGKAGFPRETVRPVMPCLVRGRRFFRADSAVEPRGPALGLDSVVRCAVPKGRWGVSKRGENTPLPQGTSFSGGSGCKPFGDKR